jgi:SNF2 family DNA or RNA helicase
MLNMRHIYYSKNTNSDNNNNDNSDNVLTDEWLEIYNEKIRIFNMNDFNINNINYDGSKLVYHDDKLNINYKTYLFTGKFPSYLNYIFKEEMNDYYRLYISKITNNPFYNIKFKILVNVKKIKNEIESGLHLPENCKSLISLLFNNSFRHSYVNINELMNNAMKPVEYKNTNFKYINDIKVKLYIYQRENIKWMLNIEKEITKKSIYFKHPNIYEYKNLCIDIKNNKLFLLNKNNSLLSDNNVKFKGGVLADQVGLGKCVSKHTYIYYDTKLYDKNNNKKFTSLKRNNIENIYINYADKNTELYDNEGYWYNLKENIYVSSLDEKENKIITAKINKIYRQKVKTKLKMILLENNTFITVTYSHKLLVIKNNSENLGEKLRHLISKKGKWVKSKDINIGDYICICNIDSLTPYNIYLSRVFNILDINYNDWVYDLEIEKHHNFIANNIICHNTITSLTLSLMNPGKKSILYNLPEPYIKYTDKNGQNICRATLSSGKNKNKMCCKSVVNLNGTDREQKYCKIHYRSNNIIDKKANRDYNNIPELKKIYYKYNGCITVISNTPNILICNKKVKCYDSCNEFERKFCPEHCKYSSVGIKKELSNIELLKDSLYYKTDAYSNYRYIKTSATLIISPNQLCEQWKKEIEKNINKKLKIYLITTKPIFEKIRIDDIIDADFVIVSFNFLINYCHTNIWIRRGIINTNESLLKDINILTKCGPPIVLYHWHRIIIDEYHELYNYQNQLMDIIHNISSNYLWGLSGTPFAYGSINYNEIIKLITKNKSYFDNNPLIHNYITTNLFRRNTKESINFEFILPPIIEDNIWLEFSDVERAMYQNHISVNIDSNMRNVYLRQLCCHPKIALATKEILNKCKTLDEVKKAMINDNEKKIDELKIKINKKIEKEINILNELNNSNKNNISDDKLSEIKLELRNTRRILTKLKSDLNNYETGITYFTQIIPKLETSKLDECSICLSTIDDNDIGMTICGHFYCYEECLKDLIKTTGKCAMCNRILDPNNIFKIEKKSNNDINKNDIDIHLKNLINKYGTKCANLIIDLQKILEHTNENIIIFSQWDNMLVKISKIIKNNNIKCLSCKGSIHQKNKSVRLFNDDDDYRIILLSTEYCAAGLNLTKASIIVFIDPIYGTEQERLSIEAQSIGRTSRLGQTKPVKVIRYFIKDSVEEDIYKNSYNTKIDVNKLGNIEY